MSMPYNIYPAENAICQSLVVNTVVLLKSFVLDTFYTQSNVSAWRNSNYGNLEEEN